MQPLDHGYDPDPDAPLVGLHAGHKAPGVRVRVVHLHLQHRYIKGTVSRDCIEPCIVLMDKT